MLIREGLGSSGTVLLLEIRARQELRAVAARQVEIVIAHPQPEYFLALVIQGAEDSLGVPVTREIIQVSMQERMGPLMKLFGNVLVANVEGLVSILRLLMVSANR